MPEARSPLAAFAESLHNVIDGPVTWFRGTLLGAFVKVLSPKC